MRHIDDARDESLVALVAVGSHDAFDVLYRRHAALVVPYAWSLASSRESAQELVQDTFVTLWRRAGELELASESLLPWLLVTCRNHAANARRSESRAARLAQRLIQRVSILEQTRPVHAHGLLDIIDSLPERDRDVVILCLIEGRTYKQAGKVLDMSETAIGKRLERSRAALRKELAHEE